MHARADEEDVRDRSDSRLLVERNPQQEDEEPEDVGHPPDADTGADRETLGEDSPRIDSEPGLDGECASGAVEGEADQELDDPT